MVTKNEGLPPKKSYDPSSRGQLMLHDKLEKFYLVFYKTYCQQTSQSGDSGW